MNKDEIKEALEYYTRLEGVEGCEKCLYSSIYGCNDTLCKDALNLITEQEKAIEELEENIDMLTKEQKGDYDFEIKQAKIDVLNELWEKVKDEGVDYKIGMRALSEEIDELIKEQLKK